MPLVQTRGAASAQGFGEFAQVTAVNYIEDVFSTYLYTGTTTDQTVTNGVDLSTKGGLVWVKSRAGASGTSNHILVDTVRGTSSGLKSNTTDAASGSGGFTSFNIDGFSFGSGFGVRNAADTTYVSWTFREQAKFFDVVTWSGTGGVRTLTHNLGSTPGSIFVKKTIGAPQSWAVYHRSLGATKGLALDLTNAASIYSGYWNNTEPTATQFTVGSPFNMAQVDDPGATYVAYLFAHDAGGFGLTGTDNVISCGSFTTDGSGEATVSLGYEPQWVLLKSATSAVSWFILDNMRGWSNSSSSKSMTLLPNTSGAEAFGTIGGDNLGSPTATGFTVKGVNATDTMIYIAIRRGPMKVPTSGTSVFSPLARTGTGTNPTVVTTGTNPDLLLSFPRTASPAAYGTIFWDKLRGVSQILQSANTNAEATTAGTYVLQSFLNTGFQTGADFINGYINYSGSTYVNYAATRAPSFFDEVCYLGTGVNGRSVSHNLAVAPELIIAKRRSSSGSWFVYVSSIGTGQYLILNSIGGPATDANMWGNTTPTSSNFYVGSSTNFSGFDYVSYLFSTCAGVSKVGSYTGTGSTLQVDCGFTSGARFVLIKRGNGSGNWYVWDSARGIVSGNDPYLLLNDTAAEVTNTDYIDTYSAGFEITASAPVNSVSDLFIFLAIA